MKIHPVGAELFHADLQTDNTKSIVTFHNYVKALHGGQWSASCHGYFTTNERSLKYPVNKKLGGSQTQSGCFGEENYLFPLHNNSIVIHHTAWSLNQYSRKTEDIKIHL